MLEGAVRSRAQPNQARKDRFKAAAGAHLPRYASQRANAAMKFKANRLSHRSKEAKTGLEGEEKRDLSEKARAR